jgi:uncharacterized repeat protein (TIGR01451 family)
MRGHSIHPSPHRDKIKSLLRKAPGAKGAGRLGRSSARRAVFFLSLSLMLAAAVNFGSSAAVSGVSGLLTSAPRGGEAKAKAAPAPVAKKGRAAVAAPALEPLGLALFRAASPSIETYDCTTGVAQTEFTLTQQVCARAAGAPAGLLFPWRVSWVVPDGLIVKSEDFSLDEQTGFSAHSYPLPAGDTATTTSGIIYNTRGLWRATLTRASGAIYATAYFNVRDTQNAAADVFVSKFSRTTSVSSGSPVSFTVVVANAGPDAAQSVHLVDALPTGASLSSFQQVSGPACAPADSGDCTIASLGARQVAEFLATYTAGGAGTALTSATVSTTTPELDTSDNTAEARFEVVNGGTGAVCSLECPNDVVVTATELDGNGAKGSTVLYETEPSGDCGPIVSTPASGSFFTVGVHTVTSTASGGGSCSFTVKVIDPDTLPAPTISCPADTGAAAASGALDATVNVGTPTTGGTVLSVIGTRSDGVSRALDDPYPVGTTTITWIARDTAPDEDGQFPPLTRTASCQQKIVVTSPDMPTISCPSDKTFAAPSGSCERTVTAAELGAPTATGLGLGPNDPPVDGVGVEGVRSDRRALTDPFQGGVTTITWTATDAVGRVVSCTQTINITTSGDVTPPVLVVPPDVQAFTDSCTAVVDDELGSATATDSCGGGVKISRTGVPTGPVIIRRPFPLPPLVVQRETFIFPVGTTIITYTATDSSGNVATGTQKVVVKERTPTPPIVTAPADLTLYTGAGATSCGVNVSDAALGSASATDNCPGVTVSRTGVPAGNDFPVGQTTITYTATDASGNTATATQKVTVIDNTPPTVVPPADVTVYLPLNSTATSRIVTLPNPATLTDNCPGVTFAYNPPSGSVFPVGETIVTVTATDAHNNSTQATFKVKVLYNFTGFFSPVANPPVVNNVNAGRAIPLKFSLSGSKGLGIFAAGYPVSQQVACDSSALLSDLEGTETSGGSTLTYSPDQYQYNWKTEGSWAGQCRVLSVKLNDGSTHTALFKFK